MKVKGVANKLAVTQGSSDQTVNGQKLLPTIGSPADPVASIHDAAANRNQQTYHMIGDWLKNQYVAKNDSVLRIWY